MKKNLHKSLFWFFLFFAGLIANQALAVSAYPYPVKITQSDGTVITVILQGDERVKWAHSSDGYSLLLNQKGVYEYAVIDMKGDLTPSGVKANNVEARTENEKSLLQKLSKGLTYSKDQVSMMKSIYEIKVSESQKAFPTTGARKLVCILMGYKDKAFTKTQADLNNLFNQVGYTAGGATGSVKDFYNENSYNQFNLTVTVAGPFTAANNMSYYGANDASGNDVNPRALVTEAVTLADPTVNFADFDNDGDGSVDGVYIIYAGYGEEAGGGADCIWAHAWSISTVTKDGKSISKYSCSAELSGNSGTTLTGIGVICHEFGHVLGAPDYYDTNYSTGGQFDGTGKWDMMASGSWNNNGITPAHHNVYTKVKVYGWATATVLSSAANITVNHAEVNQSFYQINSTTAGEYWLIENRQKVGFDAYLPGNGLLIYHVHSGIATAQTSNIINTTYPQKMYPVCANATTNPGTTASTYGIINGAGCPFPGSGAKTSFTDATTPNMKSWAGANTAKPITNIVENTTTKTVTFSFMGGSVNPTAPTATTVAASGISTTTATINGQVNANNATTTITFEYGTTTSYGSTVNGTPSSLTGATLTSVSAALTGLTANTTYNYRVKAVNSVGTTYGSNMTFTTTANPTSLNLPVSQLFATSTMPTGWTTQNVGTGITERWSMSNTANAGGAAYELKCSYLNLNPATTRIITPAINTVGVSSVTFSFKHMLDAYGTGVTLRVQTSNDKTTWTNTPWSVAATATNIAAATVNVNVTTNLNSATTYFALVADGNLYQIDYWYIDNVSITSGAATTTPTVTTTAASSITSSTATSGGNVTADGGATVTERGICYATTQTPTTANSKVTSGTGTGAFTANMSGLAASTIYYVRAYAINSNGTAYGSQVSFTTLASSGGTTSDVTIGTGTSTQGYPINCYYGYERSASIYTAAEVGKVGSISKFAWYPTLTTSYNVPIKIYVKHTTASTLTATTWATSISGATLVYSGTMAGTTANVWKLFSLSTAFNYTGGSNNLMVLVETNYGGTGIGLSTGAKVRYTTATSKHMYIRADNSAPTGNGTVSSYRPNIKLTITTASGSSWNGNSITNNVESIETFTFFPNPVSNKLTVNLSIEGQVTLKIFDIRGVMVKKMLLTGASSEIDVTDLSKGTYLISIEGGGKPEMKKFVKI
ncbi:MAG: M6 family metalloprotease domain-containing protein [Tenuifilaceae bacterium]